ncbi:MAG TPA: tetrahydrofolate dehydrogenase/cyclohydrolase catalytic domain-containing protein, partial [Bacteroidales bacterium]|nr:tetrahydrofolate dehydrogenase/cyclohydrolase catalytic domain-containing protein [Bacteroidales bacterium]
MPIIDGKQIANVIKEDIANEVRKMLSEGRKAPHLAAILVGENIASQTYVANKEKACKEVGFISTVYRLPENVTERELLDIINFVNKDNEIDGLIVQMPLPEHINSQTII